MLIFDYFFKVKFIVNFSLKLSFVKFHLKIPKVFNLFDPYFHRKIKTYLE